VDGGLWANPAVRIRNLALIAVVVALAAACTDGTNETGTETERVLDSVGDALGRLEERRAEGDADAEEAAASTGERIPEPAIRVVPNDGLIQATNWLARTYMDAKSVELVWSPVDGANEYVLYRVATADADYDAITTGDLGDAEKVFEGDEYGFIDVDVPANTFLTYVIIVEGDDGVTEPRWTEALTVDDVTPPSPIAGLSASVTADGVLLQWSPSTDNIEFAAYNVSILEDGELRYAGGGADERQASFLDPAPLSGDRTYVVAAVDFHNNVSETAEVTVTD
jgi:hypothetical protein